MKIKLITQGMLVISLWVGLSFANDDGKELDRLDQMWVQTDDRMSMEQAVARFGLDNQIEVLGADVIQINWWADDYKKVFSLVFYHGKVISRRLARVTNDPPLTKRPPNVSDPSLGKSGSAHTDK